MDNRAAQQAYRSGKTFTEVAAQFGVTRELVRAVLKRAGLTRRDGGAYVRALKRTEALEALMAEEGIGLAVAARRLGIPATAEAVEYARATRDARAITRFWKQVDPSAGPDACHPWIGTRYPNGYGMVKGAIERITGAQYAHRAAFILTHGRQPRAESLFRGVACVLHSCDNRPCCNPRHLREGTMADNMKDRDIRGRSGAHLRVGQKRTPEQRAHCRAGQARRAAHGQGMGPWWKSLTPDARRAHVEKTQRARAESLTRKGEKRAPENLSLK